MTENDPDRVKEFIRQFPVFTNAGVTGETLAVNEAEVKAELSEEFYGDLWPTLCRWLLAHKTALTHPVDSSTLTADGSLENSLEQTVFGREFLRVQATRSVLPGVY
jgi:hypothetical protein